MNSPELARQWTEFLSARKEFMRGEEIIAQFNAGTVTRICVLRRRFRSFWLLSGFESWDLWITLLHRADIQAGGAR